MRKLGNVSPPKPSIVGLIYSLMMDFCLIFLKLANSIDYLTILTILEIQQRLTMQGNHQMLVTAIFNLEYLCKLEWRPNLSISVISMNLIYNIIEYIFECKSDTE